MHVEGSASILALIELNHLTKTFKGKTQTVDALKDINLHIEQGDIFGIIGMSGAIGGGGLGQIAISYGYNRYQTDVLFVTVALLIVLMQVIQIVGMKISRKTDKRVRN